MFTPLKPPGIDAPPSVPMHRSRARIGALIARVLIALIALSQNVGSPSMSYIAGFLFCAVWTCGVMSAAPGAVAVTLTVLPALAKNGGANVRAPPVAAGTSITRIAADLILFSRAYAAGVPNGATGLLQTKTFLLPSTSGVEAKFSTAGIPAGAMALIHGSVWPGLPAAAT